MLLDLQSIKCKPHTRNSYKYRWTVCALRFGKLCNFRHTHTHTRVRMGPKAACNRFFFLFSTTVETNYKHSIVKWSQYALISCIVLLLHTHTLTTRVLLPHLPLPVQWFNIVAVLHNINALTLACSVSLFHWYLPLWQVHRPVCISMRIRLYSCGFIMYSNHFEPIELHRPNVNRIGETVARACGFHCSCCVRLWNESHMGFNETEQLCIYVRFLLLLMLWYLNPFRNEHWWNWNSSPITLKSIEFSLTYHNNE